MQNQTQGEAIDRPSQRLPDCPTALSPELQSKQAIAAQDQPMPPQLMVQPSELMLSGIRAEQIDDFKLFRFTDELQIRFETLMERYKAGLLTAEEEAEMAGISDLSKIFTFINAQLAAQATWCPSNLDTGTSTRPIPMQILPLPRILERLLLDERQTENYRNTAARSSHLQPP
jgi:hypothetical protein